MSAWTEVNPNAKSKDSIRNIKFAASANGQEQTYEVRFIGEPITFHKYFVNNKSAITADPLKCSIKKKYHIDPNTRHAVNLILRAHRDGNGNDVPGYERGQLYLAEVAPSVLAPVKAWAIRRKMDPGGKIAVDFSITVKGLKKNTRYEVVALDPSTLTTEEEAIKAYDLDKLFKPVPDDQIEAKLGFTAGGTSAAPEGTDASAPRQTVATATASATAAKPIANDLPF